MYDTPLPGPFDRERTIKGLRIRVGILQVDLYAYLFEFTFNFVYKDHKAELEDRDMELYDDDDFFMETGDPYVLNSLLARNVLMEIESKLYTVYDSNIDFQDYQTTDILEAARIKTYTLLDKESASHSKLSLNYEKTLISYTEYLYTMACIFTTSSYEIPKTLKEAFVIGSNENLDLINSDIYIVDILKDAIDKMLIILEHMQKLLAASKKSDDEN